MAAKDNLESLLLLGALGAGVYLAYKAINAASTAAKAAGQAVGAGYDSAVNTVSNGLTALFGPQLTADAANNLYYTTTFPDGSQHAVAASWVDPSSGLFNYPPNASAAATYTYQLYTDENGFHYAIG